MAEDNPDQLMQALRDAKSSDAGTPFPQVETGGMGQKQDEPVIPPSFDGVEYPTPDMSDTTSKGDGDELTVDLTLCDGKIARVKGEIIG